MKRKFGFNIPPLKIPSRAENRALKELLAGHDLSSPISPPLSAYIDRQRIDWKTEAELKKACAAIVKGCVDEPETKLNFKPLHETKSHPNLNGPGSQNTRPRPQTSSNAHNKPTPYSAIHIPTLEKPNRPISASKSVQDFRQAAARRQELGLGITNIREHPSRLDTINVDTRASATTSPSTNRPKTASDASYVTPRTGSTDRHYNATSTAITSAAITPSRPSKSMSAQLVLDPKSYQEVIKEADEKAGAWMRQQVEQRDQKRRESQKPKRPESRGWSLRPEKKDSVRPNTAADPRSKSRDLHKRNDSGARQSSSSHGWRPFSLQKKPSQSSLGDKSSHDLGRESIEGKRQDDVNSARHRVNLNRELPPLPSVDSWKEHYDGSTIVSESTPVTSPNPATHIASMIKGSGRNSAPLDKIETGIGEKRISAAHSKTSSADSCFSPASSTSRAPSGDLSERLRTMSKSTTAVHQQKHSESTSSRASKDGLVPNFSRKISIDVNGAVRSQTVAEVTALPPMPSKHQRGLRRVLSRFDLGLAQAKKNEKALTWMDLLEQEGIRTGIMIQRPTATAPIVRY